VKLDGVHAAFSPYTGVAVTTGLPAAGNTTLEGAGASAAAAGAETSFTVRCRDAFGNPRAVGGDVVAAKVVVGLSLVWAAAADNGDGTYTMTYVVPVTGSFKLEVMLGTTAVMGSPFTLVVSPSVTSAALSFAEGAGTPGSAGAATTFVIRPVDIHGRVPLVNSFQLYLSHF